MLLKCFIFERFQVLSDQIMGIVTAVAIVAEAHDCIIITDVVEVAAARADAILYGAGIGDLVYNGVSNIVHGPQPDDHQYHLPPVIT